jgi:hypothetical protein
MCPICPDLSICLISLILAGCPTSILAPVVSMGFRTVTNLTSIAAARAAILAAQVSVVMTRMIAAIWRAWTDSVSQRNSLMAPRVARMMIASLTFAMCKGFARSQGCPSALTACKTLIASRGCAWI